MGHVLPGRRRAERWMVLLPLRRIEWASAPMIPGREDCERRGEDNAYKAGRNKDTSPHGVDSKPGSTLAVTRRAETRVRGLCAQSAFRNAPAREQSARESTMVHASG